MDSIICIAVLCQLMHLTRWYGKCSLTTMLFLIRWCFNSGYPATWCTGPWTGTPWQQWSTNATQIRHGDYHSTHCWWSHDGRDWVHCVEDDHHLPLERSIQVYFNFNNILRNSSSQYRNWCTMQRSTREETVCVGSPSPDWNKERGINHHQISGPAIISRKRKNTILEKIGGDHTAFCTFVVADSGNKTPPTDLLGGTSFSKLKHDQGVGWAFLRTLRDAERCDAAFGN